ncbi:helix-turn-helix domain-containing protein [Sinorhizobium numidicum]|uniref:Helix-turn-helix domain-containing protein n=1 Tax=Sinorhizobium numidicum TaxID=680248 RepID=A0ABY8CMQ9_9HYPH|nr:helix-turn-helix domain-containing protein [Sinorhizobium numidicum]WEX73956.1 helix-turn-helix domain-containing protein [Sinorhizobium numidicum]WEX79941.1 helix-turn-helix domain-containing protein [Sinorhizobium numidicum]
MSRKRVHVSLVVFPECDPSIIYGVFDTLWAAGRLWNSIKGLPGEPLFEPRLVSAEPGPLELVTGVSIIPQDTIAEVTHTDIVFVPNVMVETAESLRALDRRLLEWIRRMHACGAQLYAACGGSLVLAEAGLLDGQQATTHWSYVPLFRRQYPNVALYADRILVQTGPGHSMICSGGASSWQDLTLLLIAKYGGTEEAIRISKLFLYQWHRDGQLPYASMIANVDHRDGVILRCQTWLAQNYERPDIVAELVRRSGLPKRTFDRRFRAATGYSPLAYVQALRIEEAKQLLETSSAPVEAVGREVGYEDSASFRRLFRRLAGMAPGDYRRKFHVPSLVERAESERGPKPLRRDEDVPVQSAPGTTNTGSAF